MMAAYNTILDETSYGLCVMDSNRRILEWNAGMEAITGWTKEEVQEMGVEVIMRHGDLIARHRKVYHEAMNLRPLTNKVVRVDCTVLTKGGRDINVCVSVRIILAPDGNRYAVANMEKQSNIIRMQLTPTPN
jgi:PAS domain S-box-containing protein